MRPPQMRLRPTQMRNQIVLDKSDLCAPDLAGEESPTNVFCMPLDQLQEFRSTTSDRFAVLDCSDRQRSPAQLQVIYRVCIGSILVNATTVIDPVTLKLVPIIFPNNYDFGKAPPKVS